ncbi:hypothetical protein Tco_0535725 [Tanacetum coccineum]
MDDVEKPYSSTSTKVFSAESREEELGETVEHGDNYDIVADESIEKEGQVEKPMVETCEGVSTPFAHAFASEDDKSSSRHQGSRRQGSFSSPEKVEGTIRSEAVIIMIGFMAENFWIGKKISFFLIRYVIHTVLSQNPKQMVQEDALATLALVADSSRNNGVAVYSVQLLIGIYGKDFRCAIRHL